MRKILIKGFLVSGLLPVLLLSVILCVISMRSQISQRLRENAATLESLAWTVESRIAALNRFPAELPESNGFSSRLSVGSLYWLLLHCPEDGRSAIRPANYGDYIRVSNDITKRYLSNENRYINSIYLITKNGGVMNFGSRKLLREDITDELWEKAKNKELPQYLYREENDLYVENADSAMSHCFSWLAEVKTIDLKGSLAVMVVDVGESVFETLYHYAELEPGKRFYVLDRSGKIVYSTDSAEGRDCYVEYCGRKETEYDMAAGEIISSYPLEGSLGMTVLYAEKISGRNLYGVMLLAISGILVFTILYELYMTMRYTGRFTRPIQELCQLMETDEMPQILGSHQDIYEFGILYKHYDQMIVSIRQHIREKYESELVMARAKMKVMESQIDSHFLYNTLECIQSMALVNGADDVADMTKSLADMFKYISRMEKPVVPVRDEVKYVQDYLMIQRNRFGRNVSCIMKVEPKYLDRYMLKLTLQPIVENVFKHGFRDKKTVHNIHITCMESEDMLQFRICDNGVGMEPEKLEEVRRGMKSGVSEGGGGLGLSNIAKRMELYYGEKAGISIESIPGEGTAVCLSFPGGAELGAR